MKKREERKGVLDEDRMMGANDSSNKVTIMMEQYDRIGVTER